jgi:folylpolyglutamate synthase
MARSYADAVSALNTLQTNFAIVDAIRKSGRRMNESAIPEMRTWFQRLGYQPSELDKLNIINVAGTKGKGSTCAFTSSILMQFIGMQSQRTGKPLQKIGLYTSPHLRFVRERIQINGAMLSEEVFARYFFEVWERLEKEAEREGRDPKDKPVYFRFLTLVAFHVFLMEGVDGAVLECGVGGRYDSTNIVGRPLVTAITRLGIDHVGMLGGTIEEIAWHKAGVMKKGVMCLTAEGQRKEAVEVLWRVAGEVGAEIVEVGVLHDIRNGKVKLGLQGGFQQGNASLAVEIATKWLEEMQVHPTNQEEVDGIHRGLELVKWPGRCETRREPGITWCIDGGHTLDSIEVAGTWFADQIRSSLDSSGSKIRCLIFNQQTRDAGALAKALHDTLATALGKEKPFSHAIFCTNTTFQDTGFRPDLISINTNASDVDEMKIQNELAETWKQIDPKTDVKVVKTIEEAVALVRKLAEAKQDGDDVTALVTGSLHLAGGFLEVIETSVDDKA